MLDRDITTVIFVSAMEYNIKEHCQVVGVDEDNAYLKVTIPLWLLDSLPALLDHIVYIARFVKIRTRFHIADLNVMAFRASQNQRKCGLSDKKKQAKM